MSHSPGQDGPSAVGSDGNEFPRHARRRPHILITGLPGVGKTTLIRELVLRLEQYAPAGFYTEEIRDARGTREGFRLVTVCGRQLVLSHIHHPGPYRVSRYGVDVAGFERLLAELDLEHAQSQLIVIDEIGKMECLSQRFRGAIAALLDSQKLLVATIASKGDGFIRDVKQRSDCRLVTITRDNRDRCLAEIFGELQDNLRKETPGLPAIQR